MNASRRAAARAALVLLALHATGCDDAASTNGAAASSTTPQATAVPTQVELKVLASLPAGRPSVVAVVAGARGAAARIFVLQANPAAPEGVNEIVDGQVRPTGLTPQAVSQALHQAAARGRITAIAPRADGRIAFTFAGDVRTTGDDTVRGLFALGACDPTAGELHLPIDESSVNATDPELISTTTRLTLLTHGDDAWLWRSDAAGKVRLLTVRQLSTLQPKLAAQSFDIGQISEAIERAAWEWSPTLQPGRFFLTDTTSRWVRTIDERGQFAHIARFDESIGSVSAAAMDAAGRVMVFACDRDGIVQSLLVQDGAVFKGLSAGGFVAAAGDVDVNLLRIDRLYAVPGETNVFIAYDATSGKVLRVTLR